MESQQTALPKLYIGIDIHKRSWKVHCTTDLFCGKSFSMAPEPEQLLNYVGKHFPGYGHGPEGTPIDTLLFRGGRLAGHKGRSSNAGLLPKTFR